MRHLVLLIISLCWAGLAAAETRLALVIHQQDYTRGLSDVTLAPQEANVIANALSDAGFAVTRAANLTKPQLVDTLDDFRVKLDRAGPEAVGFIYYTGHGAQNPETRSSYLLGTETRLRSASDFRAYGVSLAAQRDNFEAVGAKAVFMVFDACRNVPAVPGLKSDLKGLTRVSAGSEMLIAYSTDLGTLAKAGVYAPVLAEEISRPGQSAEQAFFNAQKRVAQQTANTANPQQPWADVRLYRNVVFKTAAAQPKPAPAPLLASDEGTALAQAISAGTLAAYQAFADKFPSSVNIGFVKAKIGELTPAPAAQPAAAITPTGRLVGAKLVRTLSGHMGTVRSASFSPNGRTIVTASDDRTAKIWDARSGESIRTLRGHTGGLWSAAFSPDGKTILTGSGDKTAKIWDVEHGELIQTLDGHTSGLRSTALSPDGYSLATASSDNTARIWDALNGTLKRTLHGHTAGLLSVAFSPDAQWIVTSSYDQTAKIWELEFE